MQAGQRLRDQRQRGKGTARKDHRRDQHARGDMPRNNQKRAIDHDQDLGRLLDKPRRIDRTLCHRATLDRKGRLAADGISPTGAHLAASTCRLDRLDPG